MDVFRLKPLSFKDLKCYRRNISRSVHRVVVEGMRGKSSLVELLYRLLRVRGVRVLGKITGLEPKIFYGGRVIRIERGMGGRFFLDEENVGVISRFPAEIYVAENQAITRLTMRHIHRIYRPDIVLIPNVRYEHMEGLGDSFEEIAEAFALGFQGVKHVVYSRGIEHYESTVEDVFREYAGRFGVDLRVVHIPKSEVWLPAVERVYVAAEALRLMGYELTLTEREEIIREITNSLQPDWSPLGFEWFDASKVNDPQSTKLVLEYLMEKTGKPVFILAYLRKDRLDRTFAFLKLFEDLARDDRVKKIWFSGFHYGKLLKRVGSKGGVVDERMLDIVLEEVRKEDGLLVLAVNGVRPFMKKVREALRRGRTGDLETLWPVIYTSKARS